MARCETQWSAWALTTNFVAAGGPNPHLDYEKESAHAMQARGQPHSPLQSVADVAPGATVVLPGGQNRHGGSCVLLVGARL